jgi:hypothetical protein
MSMIRETPILSTQRFGLSRRIAAVWGLGCQLFLGLALSGKVALAESASQSRMDAASEHYREGNQAFTEGNTVRAYQAYLRAWELSRSFDVACNLGRTEVELGKVRDAAEHLAFCLEYYAASGRPELRSAREKFQRLFVEVRASVAELHFEVRPVGASIELDGRLVGVEPLQDPVFVTPGAHEIRISLSGHRPTTINLNSERGGTIPITVTLETESNVPSPAPVASPPPLVPASAASSGSSSTSVRSYALLVGGGVAVLGLGVGVGFWINKNSTQDKAQSLRAQAADELGDGGCNGSRSASVCTELRNTADRSHTYGQIATVGFAVSAGALLATGIVWVATEGAASPRSNQRASRQIRFVPRASLSEVAMGVVASF